ncbi:MAG: hypothetical protein ACREMO_12825 [Gemmatimonadales bacterium]
MNNRYSDSRKEETNEGGYPRHIQVRLIWVVVILGLVASWGHVKADNDSRPILITKGVAESGINHRLGTPVFDLGPGIVALSFATIGAWNPGGSDPFPLRPETPASTLLATLVDPALLAAFSEPPPDPALLNVPLRDVAAIVAFDGSRAPLRDHLVAGQIEPSRTAKTPPVTLGQWLSAGGILKILCTDDSRAQIDLDLHDLLPLGLYTVWGGMLTPQGPYPIPFGGTPNAFVADKKGNARFSRLLNYCPMQLAADQVPLAFVEVVFHSDQSVYAGVPELNLGGFPAGTGSHSQVAFAVSATRLP